jgi:hypothetical protein
LCDDIHYIDSQPFKVAKATKFDFCDQIIHLDYIVEGTIWCMMYHNCNEFIFVKHSKSSLYNYYNVNSL